MHVGFVSGNKNGGCSYDLLLFWGENICIVGVPVYTLLVW